MYIILVLEILCGSMPEKRKEKTLGWGEPRVYYRLGSEGEIIQPGSSGTLQI